MQGEGGEKACNVVVHIDSCGYFGLYVTDLSTDLSTDSSNAKDFAMASRNKAESPKSGNSECQRGTYKQCN